MLRWSIVLYISVLWLMVYHVVQGQIEDTYPANEYEYSIRRDYLLQKEEEMENIHQTLSQDEQTVDHYLQYLKYQHFQETKDSGFPPLRPIEEVMDIIRASVVYRVLEKMPKGGNMHTHENHELSKSLLLDIVWNSSDFQNLYILPVNHPTEPWKIDFFITPPPNQNWTKVQNNPTYTKEVILEHQHLIGILSDTAKAYPSDTGIRWNEMNTLWGRGSTQIIANINIKRQYLWTLYTESLNQGIQYLETRKNFGPDERLYELSSDPEYSDTFGKKYLDTEGELDINVTMEVTAEFMEENPDFIGHNRITYTTRFSDPEHVKEYTEHAIRLFNKYPSHVKGFDLVAAEDGGHSLLFFLDNFLELYDSETQQSKVDLFLHVGETNWPKDLIASSLPEDPVGTAQNAYDAMLLGAKRLGHGSIYIKFPSLLQEIKNRNVAIEVCPVSNQLLGLAPDIRNSPAVHYLKIGIPIVLGADDPGSFGYDDFTIDWYEAFMAWGLTLRELKQISQNAINYSAMGETEKQNALTNKWTPFWDSYIQNVTTEACTSNFEDEQPEFYRILPREGALTGLTKVHVFGRHFERGICKIVQCMFGQTASTSTMYISSNHIICETEGDGAESTVNVSVSFNGGQALFDTGEQFTYKYELYTPTPTPTTEDPISGVNPSFSKVSWLIACIIGLLCSQNI